MLEKIKILLGISDNEKDNLLFLLVEQAESYFEIETGRKPTDYESIIIRMVIEDYNRLGSEGITSLSAGGTSESVANDYSPQLKKQMRSLKTVRFL